MKKCHILAIFPVLGNLTHMCKQFNIGAEIFLSISEKGMAAVGAPGTEMSDEPHIPTVTIVHRFCLNVADPVHLLE